VEEGFADAAPAGMVRVRQGDGEAKLAAKLAGARYVEREGHESDRGDYLECVAEGGCC
jgi:hypothetical protein